MTRLDFLGAINEIGSSSILVDSGKSKFILDFGGNTNTTPSTPPIQPKEKVDAVFLSHAHFDHCGSLPLITKPNPGIPVYSAPCTPELTEMLLYDSVKINIQEMGNIKGDNFSLPFTNEDVIQTLRRFKRVEYRKPFNFKDSKVNFFDAGHIPGSSMIHFDYGADKKKILYTGDFQSIDSRLLKKFDDNVPNTEILITESTYSDKDHPSRESQEKELIDIVTTTIESGGIAMIPSFAVGRAAELLLVLEQRGIDYPVYMDGMAKKATTIINNNNTLLNDKDGLSNVMKKVKFVAGNKHRNKIIRNPCAIITTSGMMDGGPINFYMSRLYNDESSSVTFTGWQAPNSVGKSLLDNGRYIGQGMDVESKVLVKRLDFSAHVGRQGILDFINKINPNKE